MKSTPRPRVLLALLVAAAVAVVAGVAYITHRGGTESSSAANPAAVAAAERIPAPSTAGAALSLDQLHGSKVVLYFYEGSG